MLHLYWGGTRGMRVRSFEGAYVEVPSDHGAWWPEPRLTCGEMFTPRWPWRPR